MSRPPYILIVDGKGAGQLNSLDHPLRNAGFEVAVEVTSNVTDSVLRDCEPDLVVLALAPDRPEPLFPLESLRRLTSAPVILLSGSSSTSVRIRGLELGADDFLLEPTSPQELVARIRSVLRRVNWTRAEKSKGGPAVMRQGELSLSLQDRIVLRGSRSVALSFKEFRLMRAFFGRPFRVFSREEILEILNPKTQASPRSVDVCIGNLRKKLSKLEIGKTPFRCVHGVGYSFL